jgi:hypothetical protein
VVESLWFLEVWKTTYRRRETCETRSLDTCRQPTGVSFPRLHHHHHKNHLSPSEAMPELGLATLWGSPPPTRLLGRWTYVSPATRFRRMRGKA